MTEDRSMVIPPGHVIRTQWVAIDACQIGCRDRMDFAAIERAGRRLLQQGDSQHWPPPVGHWTVEKRFVVCDGRHEYLAALALGRTKLFVAWIEKEPE